MCLGRGGCVGAARPGRNATARQCKTNSGGRSTLTGPTEQLQLKDSTPSPLDSFSTLTGSLHAPCGVGMASALQPPRHGSPVTVPDFPPNGSITRKETTAENAFASNLVWYFQVYYYGYWHWHSLTGRSVSTYAVWPSTTRSAAPWSRYYPDTARPLFRYLLIGPAGARSSQYRPLPDANPTSLPWPARIGPYSNSRSAIAHFWRLCSAIDYAVFFFLAKSSS